MDACADSSLVEKDEVTTVLQRAHNNEDPVHLLM